MAQHLKHIGFILDGNGRWATASGQSRSSGHEEGAKTLQKMIKALGEKNIPFATFFVFSSENWGRPQAEVNSLLTLLKRYLSKDFAEAQKNNVRVRIAGDMSPKSPLPKSLMRLLADIQTKTAENTGLTVTLCINYGGQDEIVRATKKLMGKVQTGALSPEDITPEIFKMHTDFADCPPVDLCVRTGGVQRLSNFVLWHLNYAEFYFSQTFWPAFDERELDSIIEDFQGRERRFGKLSQNKLAVVD